MALYPEPENIWQSIEYSSLGTTIAESTWMFPTLETVHVVALVTVLGMIIGEPVRELINPFFWIKMGLVVFGILIAIWFHKGVLKHVAGGRDIVASDKATAVFLIILWMMIMYCGRFIAYAPV